MEIKVYSRGVHNLYFRGLRAVVQLGQDCSTLDDVEHHGLYNYMQRARLLELDASSYQFLLFRPVMPTTVLKKMETPV